MYQNCCSLWLGVDVLMQRKLFFFMKPWVFSENGALHLKTGVEELRDNSAVKNQASIFF